MTPLSCNSNCIGLHRLPGANQLPVQRSFIKHKLNDSDIRYDVRKYDQLFFVDYLSPNNLSQPDSAKVLSNLLLLHNSIMAAIRKEDVG